jgi:hypothetical protein
MHANTACWSHMPCTAPHLKQMWCRLEMKMIKNGKPLWDTEHSRKISFRKMSKKIKDKVHTDTRRKLMNKPRTEKTLLIRTHIPYCKHQWTIFITSNISTSKLLKYLFPKTWTKYIFNSHLVHNNLLAHFIKVLCTHNTMCRLCTSLRLQALQNLWMTSDTRQIFCTAKWQCINS